MQPSFAKGKLLKLNDTFYKILAGSEIKFPFKLQTHLVEFPYGLYICLILNHLLTQILIKVNFTFHNHKEIMHVELNGQEEFGDGSFGEDFDEVEENWEYLKLDPDEATAVPLELGK